MRPCGSNVSFSCEELELFQRRYENGYDLTHDVRYNLWLKSLQRKFTTLAIRQVSIKSMKWPLCVLCKREHQGH